MITRRQPSDRYGQAEKLPCNIMHSRCRQSVVGHGPHTPHVLTGEAKEEIVNVISREVADAAAELGRDGAEQRPQGVKAARCADVWLLTTPVVPRGHEPKIARRQRTLAVASIPGRCNIGGA
jgi:hypothetical protein